ncbi:MAG: hypothetical protein HY288_00900 [Planctomycetia bacterium]|nr:hypothetical protein [Planctomycetia bacterium]
MQHLPQLRVALVARRWHVCVCACVALLLWSAVAVAQRESPADAFKTYALRHQAAPDVARMLTELLGKEAEVEVSARANQISVRGPAKSQWVAERLITAVDQPRGQTTTTGPVSLKTYPCPPHQVAARIEVLRKRYGGDESVRIAADPQSGQIMVLAPNEIHAAIAQQLAADLPRTRETTETVLSQLSKTEASEYFVTLSQWRGNQIEPTLRKLFGPRLRRQRGSIDYSVTDDAGTSVLLHVDEARGGLMITGRDPLLSQVVRLIEAYDGSRTTSAGTVRTVSLRKADPKKVQLAVDAYRRGDPAAISPAGTARDPRPAGQRVGPGRFDSRRAENSLQMAQEAAAGEASQPAGTPPGGSATAPGAMEADNTRERLRELGLDLEIETLSDLDAIILRGSNRDVNEALRIIEDIERLSAETVPSIEVLPLKHVGSEAIAPMLAMIQKDLLAGRPGRVSITALAKPNALLLIGWGDAINSVKELIDKLDQPVEPQTQLRVFRLRHAPAAAASTTVQEFFAKRTALGPKVAVTPDVRSNSLIVQAAPRDMGEVELLITRLDTARSAAVNQVRVFKLKNSLAANLATTLQSAIESQRAGQAQGTAAGGKSHALELLTVDPLGEKIIKSGILGDVKITADARANTLVVSAPVESMGLVAALIEQMDDTPVSVAQIKVFHIINGDAASLVLMLRALLPSQTATTTGTTLAKAEGETSFAPLHYSVETRTNSIIASGSAGDLAIIEALLLRLDEKEVQQRKNTVYRLKNEPADDVANAINQFLRSERQLQQAAPGTISPFQQIESEVVVVPEPVGNSLIISATPRFFEEINKLVEKLDAQPPQVLIQVLIAEVALDDTTQFGIEWGLQDSVLFDRSLLGTPIFQTTTTTFGNPPTTTQTQKVLSAANTPGFDFNNSLNPALGNSGSATSLATAAKTGGQALSNFAIGRTSDLGFGGLVLSASSKGLNALLRALQQNQRLDVLSRPQVMTMDNQPAYIQVGQKVPRVVTASFTSFGQTTGTELYDVGLILGVTPRISPEGMVVMDIDAIKSELGAEAEGIPIAVSATGNVIRSPKINITEAHTTVSSANGETIVLGGLITKSEKRLNRRVPYLADVPLVGNLFRYDQFVGKRTELLIILTPQVVRSPEDAQRLKQTEAARMHWCAADVHGIHGDGEFCTRADCPTCNSQTPVIYPDLNPRGAQPTPTPEGALPAGPNAEPAKLPGPGVSAKRMLRQLKSTNAKLRGPAPDETRPVETADARSPQPNESPAPPGKGIAPAANHGIRPPDFDQTRAVAYPDGQTSFSSP